MLGDDQASALGVRVRRTQLLALLVSVLLSAAAVTVVGPIGFIGLVAPTLVRLLAAKVPGLHRHRVLVPVSGLAGVALLLTADVLLRALIGAQQAVEVPTGVMTTLIGAGVLVALAVRLRASSFGAQGETLDVEGTGLRRFRLVLAVCAAAVVAVVVVGALVGDRVLLLGDLGVWLQGQAGPVVGGVMDNRLPRVVAALLAGTALAAAGTVIQGVTRNPLADSSIIGVSGGASVLAVLVTTFLAGSGFWLLAGRPASAGCSRRRWCSASAPEGVSPPTGSS